MDLFKYLTGYHRQQSFRKLLVAPTTMRLKFLALLDNEIRNAQAGRPAAVTCKVNGIDDEVITAKLYEASQAGVKVDLIVRGICRVRPGVRGYSENIRVVSIVGQFLEHHRVVGSRCHRIDFLPWVSSSCKPAALAACVRLRCVAGGWLEPRERIGD